MAMARSISMMTRALAIAGILAFAVPLGGAGGPASITQADLRRWVTHLSSDELEGRATYSAGLGLAAGYISEHLRDWGVEPAGDAGGYVQTIRVLGVKTTNRSALTVRVGRETRTFRHGEGVTFSANVGGDRTVTIDRVEFAGYGLDAPAADHMDFRGKNVRGAAVVWLGTEGPDDVDAQRYRRLLTGRNRYATEQLGAFAGIGPQARTNTTTSTNATSSQGASSDRADRRSATPDFTTSQRLDRHVPPNVSVSDEVLEFMFSAAPESYATLKEKAASRDDLPSFTLDDVRLTFAIDAEYEIIRTQLAQNVVGIVRGSDPVLASTYVAYGAHFDHVGYASTEVADGRRPSPPGRVSDGAIDDRVWNGADDNASGTSALMALARAFAEGPRPKRSILFVWHSGEESGLLGSEYFVDYPTVPLGSIVAHMNADMIGRNRDNDDSESNTVYLVGSDRISTELHEINREANRSLARPLTLDYEMNDPADLEQLYYRSDHYSYAAVGIPVIFFTTGLHPDYHANTDHASKIEYEKLARITHLLYETGVRVANLDHPPVRDNLGPRAGKDTRE